MYVVPPLVLPPLEPLPLGSLPPTLADAFPAPPVRWPPWVPQAVAITHAAKNASDEGALRTRPT
jgi:hypothetical protein